MEFTKNLSKMAQKIAFGVGKAADSKAVKYLAMAIAAGALQVVAPACGGARFEPGETVTEDGGGNADSGDGSAGEGGADAKDAGSDGGDAAADVKEDAGEEADAKDCTITVADESPNGGYVNKGAEAKLACVGVTPTCEATLVGAKADEMYYGAKGIIAQNGGKAWVGGQMVQGGVNGVNVGAGDNKFVFNLNKPLPANFETIVCTGGDIAADASGGAHEMISVVTNPPNSAAPVQGKSFNVNP